MNALLKPFKIFALIFVLLFSALFGHFNHSAELYYSENEVSFYTKTAEIAGLNGEVIAIGGGFDTEDRFKALIDECISHTKKETPKMLFVPTANFDLLHETEEIVEWFKNAGCETDVLLVSQQSITEIAKQISEADIIYATGGNLKFLTENWRQKGVFEMMKLAFYRGAVLIGPSSGAMCWARRGWDCCGEDEFRITDSFPFVGMDASYDYYHCANIIPFCICPHFNNIAWRVFAFNAAELDIPSLCIENGAAVVYKGGRYSVISDSKTPSRTAYFFNPGRNMQMLDVKKNADLLTVSDGEYRLK
ncbi:MAG: Type 1 glutamine amidotransferase-like domain-containing protein [Clostridia bacterium]|nr:Type 1 glutamine amidotransferase-like domain-containing protein [Clostridia bacterium]